MAGFGGNGPYDYTVQQPDLGASLLGGIAAGQQLGAQRAAQQKSEQYAADLQTYLSNPTPQSAAALTVKYPEQREAFKQSWDILGKDQQDQQFKSGVQVYSALQNSNQDAAKEILDKQIAAMENSGQDATNYKSIRDSIDRNPAGVAAQIGLTLSALEPDKWSKIAGEMRESAMAPAKQTEATAKAQKAAVDAKYAESGAVQDLQKGGWEIQKLANDINISRQNAQIAAMNAATNRMDSGIKSESNALKRDELKLKIQDKIAERDNTIRTKAAEVSSARGSIDNFLNTADRVLQTDPDVIGSAAGPVSSRLPTLGQDTADFEELLSTLSSQAFMSQIPAMKGLGALSEKEGDKLQTSLQNLSLRQSPERLLENVREAQRLILKSRENLSTKYGIPDVTPDTPAAQPSPSNIDALLQKYGGQ